MKQQNLKMKDTNKEKIVLKAISKIDRYINEHITERNSNSWVLSDYYFVRSQLTTWHETEDFLDESFNDIFHFDAIKEEINYKIAVIYNTFLDFPIYN